MKKINRIFLLLSSLIIAITSCNQIKEDNRVLVKGANDSILIIKMPTAGCQNCKKIIEDGLFTELGLSQSILNLKNKEVSIVYNPKIISSEKITKTIAELSAKMPCK